MHELGAGIGAQTVRLEDLRLVLHPDPAQPLGRLAQILGHAPQSVDRPCLLVGPAFSLRLRVGVTQDDGTPDRHPSRCGQPAKLALGHFSSAIACSSAEMISAVEVAPGSWWPMLRSPR